MTVARASAAALAACPGLTGVGATRLREGPWRVVVAGAGGWLGLAALELLHGLLGERFAERVKAFGSSARTLSLRGGVSVDQQPLSALADLPPRPTLVLHLAFLTQEKASAMSEADYIAANRAISGAVLAALDGLGAEGVFLPSSGAVYMVDRPQAQAAMRLYGRMKLEDETAFADWSRARRKRAVIARVFNLSGPYINKQSSYALACFIADALAGRPIEIRATRPVLRSYAAISELMSVVFGALTDGEAGPVLFDTAGDEVLEMDEIASVVERSLSPGHGVRRPPLTESEPDRYTGDGAVYRRFRDHLGIEPVAFSRQVEETSRFMAGEAGT
ncbi:MAG: nucleoside-diphosphate-sugar epimerase [Caulobacteraceae bacterium]|nr:nucleoside-diphosphate-sugar epimerase [Caulobacteraceae bacterium]